MPCWSIVVRNAGVPSGRNDITLVTSGWGMGTEHCTVSAFHAHETEISGCPIQDVIEATTCRIPGCQGLFLGLDHELEHLPSQNTPTLCAIP